MPELNYHPPPPRSRPDLFTLVARILVLLTLTTLTACLAWCFYVHLNRR